jgi:hypothetical protein
LRENFGCVAANSAVLGINNDAAVRVEPVRRKVRRCMMS